MTLISEESDMARVNPESEKIGGFDKYDVRNAARTMIEAKEFENGDKKFYAVVLKEVDKIAKAAMEAAEQKSEAAKEITLTKKVDSKLKSMYGK